jgi:hypothetical protein
MVFSLNELVDRSKIYVKKLSRIHKFTALFWYASNS